MAAKMRFATKTKTGCLTCRQRRIKCDEGKPQCANCARSGWICGGYQARTALQNRSHVRYHDGGGVTAKPPVALQSHFGTSWESHSFQLFIELTAEEISRFSNPHFWKVLVPQVSQQHEAVKHALLATTLAFSERKSFVVSEQPKNAAVHYYSQAISAVIRNPPDADIVLLLSVLFWTYENLAGHAINALKHLYAAIRILNERSPKGISRDDLISEDIEPTIGEGLVAASTVLHPGGSDVLQTPSLAAFLHEVRNATPRSRMKDLYGARVDLVRCMRCLILAKQIMMSPSPQMPSLEPVIDLLRQWKSAFDRSCSDWRLADVRALNMTYHKAVMSAEIMQQQLGGGTQDQELWGNQFSYLVEEAEFVESQTLHHAADLGVISTLAFIARFSPDEETAEKALTVLSQSKKFEGMWDGGVCATLMRTVREVDRQSTNCHSTDFQAILARSAGLKS